MPQYSPLRKRKIKNSAQCKRAWSHQFQSWKPRVAVRVLNRVLLLSPLQNKAVRLQSDLLQFRFKKDTLKSVQDKRKSKKQKIFQIPMQVIESSVQISLPSSFLHLSPSSAQENTSVNISRATQLYSWLSNGMKVIPVKCGSFQESLSLCSHTEREKKKAGSDRKTQQPGRQSNQRQNTHARERAER